jgi:hypothetical protein
MKEQEVTTTSRTADAKAKQASSRKKFFADAYAKYGITEAEYRALYRAQGGRCYVCRKADGTTRRLGIDHNHLTGEVRGLVCTGSRDPKTCNRLIAYYDRAQLVRAVEMLSDPPPARAVLFSMRNGWKWIPSVVGNPDFERELIEVQ